jgi:hypothetical protein
MKKALATLALLLLVPSAALAVPTLTFDTTPGGAGGTLTYDGAGGAAIGDGIVFVDIASNGDTPLNPNTTLDCVACTLHFETGLNNQEGPGQLWTWDGGGTFTLTGTVPSIGINAPVALISGSFVATANTPAVAGADPNALFIAIGIDTKDPALTTFFGLGPNFNFANTEIALGTFISDPVTGAFTAVPNQADIINTQAVVPFPATGLLLGLGLLVLGSAPALRRLV